MEKTKQRKRKLYQMFLKQQKNGIMGFSLELAYNYLWEWADH
jgi:hypothetical protein